MNWALIRRISFIPCIGMLLIVSLAEVDASWSVIPEPLFTILLVGALAVFNLALPSWFIGKRMVSDRFLSGCCVVAIGSTFGLVAGILVGPVVGQFIPDSAELYRRGLGQAVGFGLFALWIIGLLTSPATGLCSVLVGKLVSRNTGSGSGAPTSSTQSDTSQAPVLPHGSLFKCGTCGAAIPPAATACPSCGFVFGDGAA